MFAFICAVPRKVVNPRCNAKWETGNLGIDFKDQYVESTGVNYYRLHPNYFFRNEVVQAKVVVQGYQSQVVVCTSRKVENPR